MNGELKNFVTFIKTKDGVGNKSVLIRDAVKKFNLTKDRSVYYCENFSVRFSFSSSRFMIFPSTLTRKNPSFLS